MGERFAQKQLLNTKAHIKPSLAMRISGVDSPTERARQFSPRSGTAPGSERKTARSESERATSSRIYPLVSPSRRARIHGGANECQPGQAGQGVGRAAVVVVVAVVVRLVGLPGEQHKAVCLPSRLH